MAANVVATLTTPRRAIHRPSKRHERGARRFAGTALQAELEHRGDGAIERDRTRGDGAHRVEAAPR